MKRGKYGSFYNSKGVKIRKNEYDRFVSLIPQVKKFFKSKKTEEFRFTPSVRRLDYFGSREVFLKYLRKMQQIASGTYYRNQIIQFRKNLIKAINNRERNSFPPQEIERLTKRIQAMNLKDFEKYSRRFKWRAIGYIYYEEDPNVAELSEMYHLTSKDDRLYKELHREVLKRGYKRTKAIKKVSKMQS